jgi:uncharacterized protein (TIGR03435 family)
MRPTIAALLLLTASQTSAQSIRAFEVASVKPSLPGRPGGASLDAGHFICSGMTLRSVIFSVYGAPAWRLAGGPAWLDTDPWDIAATLPPNMPAEREDLMRESDLMVQALLAQRFKLRVHREMREQAVYELVVAKGGSKLKPSSTDKFSVKTGRGHFEFHHASMAVLVSFLYCRSTYCQQVADRPVLDMTGIKGFFDLTLDWTPDTVRPDPAATGPSLFTALEEQTGLQLEPRKSPFEFLVIDHVEKPGEN